MYTRILLTIFTLFSFLLFNTCSDPEELYRPLVPGVEGVPAGGVENFELTSIDANTAEFSMSLFAVDHFGKFIQGLEVGNFSIENAGFSPIEYEIVSITEMADEEKGPYSAAMLFDQSGSINSTDPTNDRIVAGISFANLINSSERAMIAAFSSGGFYPTPFGTLVDFTNDQEAIRTSISSLAGRADGGTPLYQAIYELIPITAAEPTNENHAIVAFTDGEDTDGGVSIDDIVNRACEFGVAVYTVGLGQGVEQSELSEIAFRTGGAVMLAENAIQLVSMYSSMGDLLKGQGVFYNLRIRATNPNGFGPGNFINGTVGLDLTDDYALTYPFTEVLTQQNAGELDQRVPSCKCNDSGEENPIIFWRDMATEMSREILPEVNPEIENLRVTCMYTNLYQENNDKFKWAGLAAIVSGKIGEKIYDPGFVDALLEFAGNTITLGSVQEMRNSIIQGNLAVFNDLVWKHLAYADGGMEELEKLYCYAVVNEPESFPLEVYQAWLKINSELPADVWQGNLDLLRYEQAEVLQDIIYDPYPILWDLLELFGEVTSPVPGQDEAFPGSDIENFNQRWDWLTTSIIPAWKTYETNPTNTDALKAVHRSYCSNCCD